MINPEGAAPVPSGLFPATGATTMNLDFAVFTIALIVAIGWHALARALV